MLARFTLRNSYVQYKGTVYLQKIGTAMGTSSSVEYANIFMLKLEDKAFNLYQHNLELAKRFLDDYYFLMSGRAKDWVHFTDMLESADDKIALEWQNPPRKALLMLENGGQIQTQPTVFMDSKYQISEPFFNPSYGKRMRRIIICPYDKANNKHTYIPDGSSHSILNKSGWYYGEVCRALIHSDSIEIWTKELQTFACRLQNRGHRFKRILKAFKKVTWGTRNKLLQEILLGYGHSEKHTAFLDKHKGLCFSIREFPGHRKLRNKHLQVQWLRSESTVMEPLFADNVALVFKSPITLGRMLSVKD